MLLVVLSLMPFVGCRGDDARHGVTAVWAVDETEKIRRDDLNHPLRTDPANAVWTNGRIHIEGAANEVLGFQVILEAAGTGADTVTVRLDSLAGPSGVIKNTTASPDLFDYRGRRIELFLESYVHVEKRREWWLASARPLPDELHMGWIPDALVPFEVQGHFENGGGGAPFRIAAGTVQGVWVDVFVPRGTVPGEYTGSLQVLEGGRQTFDIPVTLRVFAFELSDTTHLRSHMFFGSPTITARHGLKQDSREYREVYQSYAKVFHRHRLDLLDGARTLESFIAQMTGYYTGEAFTPARGYDGPGIGVGNRTYSIGTYDQPDDGWRSGFSPDTREAWQHAADRWEGWFREHAPGVVRYKYLEDEPPHARWPEVKKKADWIRTSRGPGKSLGVHVTTRMGRELYGSITDWMTSGHAGWADSGGTTGFDITVARERMKAGERVGFYNGQRPSYGEPVALDNFAADARVNPWIAWKYGADCYFLWETAYYAGLKLDPWMGGIDGSIIYTGEDRVFPGESRGLRGPIVSIRLKNLRRGFQDYEYLWLAHRMGIDTRAIVNRVVPAAFNDYNGSTFTSQSDQPTWATHGHVYEAARRAIAEQIGSKSAQGKRIEGRGTGDRK
jgi:hypothetical protein